jgi:predicted ATPase with chaperone activity
LRSNIAGQKLVPLQRALEIAVAGGHHLLTKKGTAIGDV